MKRLWFGFCWAAFFAVWCFLSAAYDVLHDSPWLGAGMLVLGCINVWSADVYWRSIRAIKNAQPIRR